jgi:hypothetical protein
MTRTAQIKDPADGTPFGNFRAGLIHRLFSHGCEVRLTGNPRVSGRKAPFL